MSEIKEIINLRREINSIHVFRKIFSFLDERRKLNIIIYSNQLQKELEVDFQAYKNMSGRYKIGGKNGEGKEYILNSDILIFEGEYKNGKRNGKGKEYNNYRELIYDGEYLNGKKNGKGKEYNLIGKLEFEGEFKNGKRWNGAAK